MSQIVDCTKEVPWNGVSVPGVRVRHNDAHEIDCSCDCCAKYRCENCGHEWKEELPE